MDHTKKQNLVAEQLRFLGRLIASPKSVGAIAPSSAGLARAMAAQMDPGRDGPVLELGAGTGALTREILARGVSPERLTIIERDLGFVKLIVSRFPGVRVVHGDAFALDKVLVDYPPFSAVISGLPLLNHAAEMRAKLAEGVLAKLEAGAPFIQFSYGLTKPVSPPKGASAKHAAFVWRNLPPAHVWVYRRS